MDRYSRWPIRVSTAAHILAIRQTQTDSCVSGIRLTASARLSQRAWATGQEYSGVSEQYYWLSELCPARRQL